MAVTSLRWLPRERGPVCRRREAAQGQGPRAAAAASPEPRGREGPSHSSAQEESQARSCGSALRPGPAGPALGGEIPAREPGGRAAAPLPRPATTPPLISTGLLGHCQCWWIRCLPHPRELLVAHTFPRRPEQESCSGGVVSCRSTCKLSDLLLNFRHIWCCKHWGNTAMWDLQNLQKPLQN